MKFGIIGYGRFGKLWAKSLVPFGEVWIYDKIPPFPCEDEKLCVASLVEVAQSDILFLLMPISELESVCKDIKSLLRVDTLVVDGCSVKLYPLEIMQKTLLTSQPILGTHPLFGPDSVKKNKGLSGHKMVICATQTGEKYQALLSDLFRKMGLDSLTTTAEQHDKAMASSQGLVHFIGRGLAALDLQPQAIATPDFQALLNINHMVVNDTWRLFLDMHRYNPYAKTIRKKLIHQLNQLEEAIEQL